MAKITEKDYYINVLNRENENLKSDLNKKDLNIQKLNDKIN